MYLPDFNGLDLVRQLAASGAQVPDFLLVTAARDIDSVRTAMQLGAFYYLVKPFSFAALREQLEAYRAWAEQIDRASGGRPARRRRALQPPRRATAPGRGDPCPTADDGARPGDRHAAPAPIGAAEVAEILGASRPTAQRYLAGLVKKQLLDLDLAYGSSGRPEHRYLPRRALSGHQGRGMPSGSRTAPDGIPSS